MTALKRRQHREIEGRTADNGYLEVEFDTLTQEGSDDDYLEEFETLRTQMLDGNSFLNEAYFLSSFIKGLKVEIKIYVKLVRPTILSQAIEQARIQEKAIESSLKKKGVMLKPVLSAYNNQLKSSSSQSTSKEMEAYNSQQGVSIEQTNQDGNEKED